MKNVYIWGDGGLEGIERPISTLLRWGGVGRSSCGWQSRAWPRSRNALGKEACSSRGPHQASISAPADTTACQRASPLRCRPHPGWPAGSMKRGLQARTSAGRGRRQWNTKEMHISAQIMGMVSRRSSWRPSAIGHQSMHNILSMMSNRRSRRQSAMQHQALHHVQSMMSSRSSRRLTAMDLQTMHI